MTFKQKLHNVRAFAFDVDGVFSNLLFLSPHGELMRTMNVKDGFALQYALRDGYQVAIISGADSESVRTRFRILGVEAIYMKSSDKIHDFRDFLSRFHLEASQVLYMGDDLPDIEVMQEAGVATCPSDAAVEIRALADYISPHPACGGCVRDVIEQTLRLQGRWNLPGTHHW
jgi:3-deoxy-D-manno-octulosonate 8-phosphate phosphatase (KDO 8-P phosphatase)